MGSGGLGESDGREGWRRYSFAKSAISFHKKFQSSQSFSVIRGEFLMQLV